jgi:hypothetical protein
MFFGISMFPRFSQKGLGMTTNHLVLALALPSALFACSKSDGGAPNLIANFTKDNSLNPVDGRQGGFYVYADPSPQGQFDPPLVKGQAYPIDTTTGNPNGSGPGSFHTKATGWGIWGAALGADFMPKVDTDAGVGPDGTGFKGTYDASKYKGVSFWAKAAAPLTGVQVSFPDVYTDAAANPTVLDPNVYPCVYTAGAQNNCSPYLVKLGSTQYPNNLNDQIDTTWKQFDILFADTLQDQFNPGFHTDANQLDVHHLTAMAIQVNAMYVNGVATPNDFEIWVDDVYFIE